MASRNLLELNMRKNHEIKVKHHTKMAPAQQIQFGNARLVQLVLQLTWSKQAISLTSVKYHFILDYSLHNIPFCRKIQVYLSLSQIFMLNTHRYANDAVFSTKNHCSLQIYYCWYTNKCGELDNFVIYPNSNGKTHNIFCKVSKILQKMSIFRKIKSRN